MKVQDLSLDEKLQPLVLKEQFISHDLGGKIPAFTVHDGPCGLRSGSIEEPLSKKCHCYPVPSVLANSWDKEAVRGVGEAIASDCISENVDIILAPGINIKRNPLCGRNFEYFSEDPYLVGELAAEYIMGCQDKGVGVSLKHFCANNREWDRRWQTSEIDERTLREIYTKAFEMIFKKVQPYTVMCSYNPLNGINIAENEWALRTLLRETLGFNDGVIVSDWGAVHDRSEALNASLDLMAPFEQRGMDDLYRAKEDGSLDLKKVDESVERLLKLIDTIVEARKTRKALTEEERKQRSINAAEKGVVLLKNNGVLPLKDKKIFLAGKLVEKPYIVGGGSGQAVPKEEIESLQTLLQKELPESEISYEWLYSASSINREPANVRVVNVKNALGIAYDSDVTVMVVGDSDIVETECYDRENLRLPEVMENMILRMSERAQKLVIVIEAGGAIDMSAWIDKVDAVVYAGYLGENVNQVLARVLSGKVNPSGRLAETFPLRIEDTATGLGHGGSYCDRYKEGVLVGYRWYDTMKKPVLFPFGYGLSYSNFVYSDFKVERKSATEYTVSFSIKNTSEFDGGEVAQLYVRNVDMMVERPEKELRRFEKVYLKAGEKKTVTFEISDDCFAYYNTCRKGWTVDKGRYEILVCRDANTVIFTEKVKI